MRVSAIGSPIGKIPVGAPLEPELDRMRRVADVAGELGTTIVRVFSFFIPAGDPPERYRQQVIDRMGALAGIAEDRGLVLAHENEKEIYGDTPRAVRRPDRRRSARLPCGRPSTRRTSCSAGSAARRGLRPAPAVPGLPPGQGRAGGDGRGRAGGQGDGQVRETLAALRDSGFAGYVSLEPHLAQAGRFGGFSGPQGFRRAAQALKSLLNELSISYRNVARPGWGWDELPGR